MKRILVSVLSMLGAFIAHAEPVKIDVASRLLYAEGARSLQGAILYGDPTITGEYFGQGFTATLLDCEKDGSGCNSVRFRACHDSTGVPRAEMLEILNAYNNEFYRGTAFVQSDGSYGDVMCLKYEIELLESNFLQRKHIRNAGAAMEDFEEHIENALLDRLSASFKPEQVLR